MNARQWVGANLVAYLRRAHTRYPVEILLTEQAAGELANHLRGAGMVGSVTLPESLQELRVALDYVLIGDPSSVAAHKRLEAAKAMEPAGADASSYAPTHAFRAPTSQLIPANRCVHSADGTAHKLCFRFKSEHAS